MAGEIGVRDEYGGQLQSRPDERTVAELAERQHGVVARVQLVGLGFSSRAIDRRLQAGRLHMVHRGVYAVGHRRISGRGLWLSAVLACGPSAVLSHRSAAALWGIRRSESRLVQVTVQAGFSEPRAGIELHRTARLRPDDRRVVDRIPVTSVALTLLGLAEELRPTDVERALEAAERLRILDMRAVHDLVDRRRGCRGVATLRAVATTAQDPPNTRRELERRFAELCRRSNLPKPVFNTLVEGFEVDALWPDHRLIVELDSFEFHKTRAAFERDRARDARLQLAGYTVLRITWRKLTTDPRGLVEMLRTVLAPHRDYFSARSAS